MKKLFLGLNTLVVAFLLVACQSAASVEEKEVDSNALTATLTVKFEDKTDTKTVHFEKDDSVMDILEENYEVDEDNGMVTAIDGVSQDVSKKTYWMYDINDELAPKGAEEMTVAEGDTIVFYLETFE
ncbi:DUF4430 domain-containing protein [Streptococcus cameli]